MPLRKNIVSFWKLDEASGTRVDSFNGNDLTDFGADAVSSVAGKIGDAAEFSSGLAQVLYNSGVGGMGSTTALTVAFWFKLNGAATGNMLITKGDDGAGSVDWGIYASTSGGNANLVFQCNSNTDNGSTSAAIAIGTWYHVVVTLDFNAAEIKWYINGSLDQTLSTSGTTLNDSSSQLCVNDNISTNDPPIGIGNEFDIDELGYWSRALTAGEVTSLYNSGSGLAGPGFLYQLSFHTQPTNTAANATIASVTVDVLDENSARDTNATDTIDISILNNPGGGTLSGTTSQSASSGAATFNDLSINAAGNGYTLTVTADADITGATSSTFNITGASFSAGWVKATHGIVGQGVL